MGQKQTKISSAYKVTSFKEIAQIELEKGCLYFPLFKFMLPVNVLTKFFNKDQIEKLIEDGEIYHQKSL